MVPYSHLLHSTGIYISEFSSWSHCFVLATESFGEGLGRGAQGMEGNATGQAGIYKTIGPQLA